jgi:hypothetical protein
MSTKWCICLVLVAACGPSPSSGSPNVPAAETAEPDAGLDEDGSELPVRLVGNVAALGDEGSVLLVMWINEDVGAAGVPDKFTAEVVVVPPRGLSSSGDLVVTGWHCLPEGCSDEADRIVDVATGRALLGTEFLTCTTTPILMENGEYVVSWNSAGCNR